MGALTNAMKIAAVPAVLMTGAQAETLTLSLEGGAID